jgi:hypothetical protein
MDKFLEFKTDEILTCLLLIVVGYVIAKMFNGCSNNGFSVGIQRRSDGNNCVDGETCNAGGDTQYRYPCPGGGQCYNLVIDDGNDKHCKNPEGVYGDSNDTYCIQGESNPVNPVNPIDPTPKSTCISKNRIWVPNDPKNNQNDQYGGECTTCIFEKADVNNDCKYKEICIES